MRRNGNEKNENDNLWSSDVRKEHAPHTSSSSPPETKEITRAISSSSAESIANISEIFIEQKQLLMNQEIQMKYYHKELNNLEMKIQHLTQQNHQLNQLNEETLEKIDINYEMKENLIKEFHELYSSKSNMMLTLQAIHSKIDEVSKKTTEEIVKLHQMIEDISMKIDEVKGIQSKERGQFTAYSLPQASP